MNLRGNSANIPILFARIGFYDFFNLVRVVFGQHLGTKTIFLVANLRQRPTS